MGCLLALLAGVAPRIALTKRESGPGATEIIERLRETTRRMRIRCPACGWQPDASSRWWCVDTASPEYFSGGCHTSWNTFDTRGRCPGCSHQWQWTCCLECSAWARHDEWYETEPDDTE